MAKKELSYYEKIYPTRQRSYNMVERVLMIIATAVAAVMVLALAYFYLI
ncbi:MAG: hypothetical protein J5867_06860 [Prevotella sp.]|nr:hypothetical protein [Prevotella sp.]